MDYVMILKTARYEQWDNMIPITGPINHTGLDEMISKAAMGAESERRWNLMEENNQ